MKECQKCKGTKKLYQVSAKCSDMYSHNHLGGKDYQGYVPDWIGVYGDYVSFTLCRHCGQIQSEDWPNDNPESNQYRHGTVAV